MLMTMTLTVALVNAAFSWPFPLSTWTVDTLPRMFGVCFCIKIGLCNVFVSKLDSAVCFYQNWTLRYIDFRL
jgi:hypothetical protein